MFFLCVSFRKYGETKDQIKGEDRGDKKIHDYINLRQEVPVETFGCRQTSLCHHKGSVDPYVVKTATPRCHQVYLLLLLLCITGLLIFCSEVFEYIWKVFDTRIHRKTFDCV